MVVKHNEDGVALKGFVQRYEWGKKGEDSLVARLAKSSAALEQIEEGPYAELWFGSHPSGPSKLKHGATVFQDQLPFLLKVLSVGKALSIQAHPDAVLAKECHAKRPDLYKDPNHKPEMAIALTQFEALVGFRPLREIDAALNQYPVFKKLTRVQQVKSAADLKEAFGNLMRAQPDAADFEAIECPLFERLKRQYPGDIGCFCAFFLNYVTLQPGQAVFLGPNEPHAYLSGDCVECMANSDNVVRAGLTPKYRDVDLLLKMLTYESHEKSDLIQNGEKGIYETLVEEFYLQKFTQSGAVEVKKQAVLLVVQGSVRINDELLAAGEAFYIKGNKQVGLQSAESFLVFKAESKSL